LPEPVGVVVVILENVLLGGDSGCGGEIKKPKEGMVKERYRRHVLLLNMLNFQF